jgi:hypothetical protein
MKDGGEPGRISLLSLHGCRRETTPGSSDGCKIRIYKEFWFPDHSRRGEVGASRAGGLTVRIGVLGKIKNLRERAYRSLTSPRKNI